MHVGIVLHPFGNSSKGLEQYVFESTKAILEKSVGDITVTVFVKGDSDTSSLPAGTPVIKLPDSIFWNLFLIPWYRKCDTFIFFTESAPFFLWKKSIIVFLDAAYYHFVESTFFSKIKRIFLAWWRKHMMLAAQHVVTISEASKKDLLDIFKIQDQHVSVIYPGFKSLKYSKNTITLVNEKTYFMYVGPMKERKNVVAIVEAYIRFHEMTDFNHQLILVGRKSSGTYADKVNKLVEKSIYRDSIIFKTSVNDEELQEMYTQAAALVYPSLLEGFGLPILEALSCGCMVITSNTTSTKEVVGKAGFLVNPHEVYEIADAMAHVANYDYDEEEFKVAAREQCDKFSWEKSGVEWCKILREKCPTTK
ncbi:MAG: glycosyltransferase family 4 protein [Candidatus Pacebacteria bacterium]|nr:glycosyltransferase family 4 protein [Candidatus Paceibacterota bacterium]MCF7856942.1 glycosyltransferase family 4 protein [Candidatus Paceibacterota bacterium]